jgi:hypothetical protein
MSILWDLLLTLYQSVDALSGDQNLLTRGAISMHYKWNMNLPVDSLLLIEFQI